MRMAILFVDKSLFILTLIFFLLGLYGHRLFGLFLRRYEWEHYDKVFVLPFGRNAYAVGNSILVGKKLLEEDNIWFSFSLGFTLAGYTAQAFSSLFAQFLQVILKSPVSAGHGMKAFAFEVL